MVLIRDLTNKSFYLRPDHRQNDILTIRRFDRRGDIEDEVTTTTSVHRQNVIDLIIDALKISQAIFLDTERKQKKKDNK